MRTRTSVALAVVVVAICGCGSSHHASTQRRATSEQSLPAPDRSALLEIARDSATLRLSAAPISVGMRRSVDRASLGVARSRLAALRPADPQLARLSTELAAACATFLRSAGTSRVAAQRAVAATDSVNAGLRRYAAKHPAVAGLIPD